MRKNIEIKEWKEYTDEEKKELLNHWWHYYGKVVYTFDEWEKFNELVDKNSNKMMELAVAGFIYGITSQPLIAAMRKNQVDELLATLPNLNEIEDEEFIENYKEAKNLLISQLVGSYNQPEPDIPMNNEEVIEQVKEIVKLKK